MKQISIIDDFFTEEEFNIILNLSKRAIFNPVSNKSHGIYAHRCTFSKDFKGLEWVIPKIEKTFNKKLTCEEFNFDMRKQYKDDVKMPGHVDDSDYNFICYLEGKHTLYNGTGFCCDTVEFKGEKKYHLNTYIGFQKNRALFFSGSKIHHGNLQNLGDSGSRTTFTIFFDEINN